MLRNHEAEKASLRALLLEVALAFVFVFDENEERLTATPGSTVCVT